MPLILFGPTTFDAELVIFDKDGTLIEFAAVWQSVYLAGIDAAAQTVENPATVRAELHGAMGYDPVASRFSMHGPFATAANVKIGTVAATVLYRYAQPPLTWDEAEAVAERTMLAAMAAPFAPGLLTPTADLPALFGALQGAGVSISVITSDERAQTIANLEALGVKHLVGLVVASDDPYPKKPAPEAIWAACTHFGVPVQKTVMVGDSLTDMRMGRAAGVGLCVAVLTGPGTLDDLSPHADVVLASVGEIWIGQDDKMAR